MFNDLLLNAIQHKMERLQRKLERYATVFFGKDMRVMYISKEKLDSVNVSEESKKVGD